MSRSAASLFALVVVACGTSGGDHSNGPSYSVGDAGAGAADAGGGGSVDAAASDDGSVDAAVTSLNARPVLLRNGLTGNRWIGLQLEGVRSNRDAIGARVTVHLGKRRLIRWVTGGSSYLASHDRRVVVGLGNGGEAKVSVEIRWPRGLVQTVADLRLNTYHKIREAAVAG